MDLAQKIDRAGQINDDIKRLDAQKKILNGELEDLNKDIVAAIQNQGTFGADGATRRATIKEETNYSVINWDDFWNYVVEEQAYYLIPKSVKQAAVRELDTQGMLPDFINTFSKTKLSLRKIGRK